MLMAVRVNKNIILRRFQASAGMLALLALVWSWMGQHAVIADSGEFIDSAGPRASSFTSRCGTPKSFAKPGTPE